MIMKELMNINWKWMQHTNDDDNLPITFCLSEDNIPISLLKQAYNSLNTEFKKNSFVNSMRNNRFAMTIINNFITFKIAEVQKDRSGTMLLVTEDEETNFNENDYEFNDLKENED